MGGVCQGPSWHPRSHITLSVLVLSSSPLQDRPDAPQHRLLLTVPLLTVSNPISAPAYLQVRFPP